MMEATLKFDLPEDEVELKAAVRSMDYLASIRDFQERLRSLVKYGHSYASATEALEAIYQDYLAAMEKYL